MNRSESADGNPVEPTEAEVMRGSYVLHLFWEAGWLKSMNPEDQDVVTYAILKNRGEPGDHTTIPDSPEIWDTIRQDAETLMAEHIAGRTSLAEAQARYVDAKFGAQASLASENSEETSERTKWTLWRTDIHGNQYRMPVHLADENSAIAAQQSFTERGHHQTYTLKEMRESDTTSFIPAKDD